MRRLSWLALLLSGAAHASSTCYSDRDYPAIASLEPTPSGYRIVLSGIFRDRQGSAPVLEHSSRSGWRPAGSIPCGQGCVREEQGCALKLPDVELTKEAAESLLGRGVEEVDQKITACVGAGEHVYFGIGFYRGEGSDGVGGIGRYDKRTGKVEIRRPERLRGSSVTHLAHDGRSLWIGTGNQHECVGMVPAEGLLRYDWSRDVIESFPPAASGMCGFMVRGILVDADSIVVATDVGLAVRSRQPSPGARRWQHLVPDLKAAGLMRQTSCEELYERLLRTVSPEEDCCGWSAASQLRDALEDRYPSLLDKHRK